jgi:hypothetical protein
MRRRNRHRLERPPGGDLVCDRSRSLYRAWQPARAMAKQGKGGAKLPEGFAPPACRWCSEETRRRGRRGPWPLYCERNCRREAEYERDRLRTRIRRDAAEVALNEDLDRENGGIYSTLRCEDGTPFVAWIASIQARIHANQTRIRALGGREPKWPGNTPRNVAPSVPDGGPARRRK